jgi:hypothetical protein
MNSHHNAYHYVISDTDMRAKSIDDFKAIGEKTLEEKFAVLSQFA